MFENDDWDIDEDYLKDFNADEALKKNNKEETIQTLPRENAQKSKNLSSNTSRFEFNCSTLEESKNEVGSQSVDTATRKNVILDIFKNTINTKKDLNFPEVSNGCGKSVVLDVFQQNEQSTVKTNVEKFKPIVKSVLKITEVISENENKLKRKKNVAFSESTSETNNSKKICITSTEQLIKKTKENFNLERNDEQPLNFNGESNMSKNISKKQMFLDLLKSPIQKNMRAPRIKQTVIRKFPGPAGLLPDDIEESEVIDLDSLEENKNNKNKYANVCSQNTKNLFTTGAWQLMMDDLPVDFELYDIATVKENALEYSRTYKKVPYLAGIIQHIDYKPNDPHVVLKDLSGKIDARIHHSICKLYPNALGTSIVVLVKDVGLIVTSKKYVCVIISPKNLVSIYSDDARLVQTPYLENLIDNNYNCNLHESQISIIEEEEDLKNNKKHNTECSSESVKSKSNNQNKQSVVTDDLNDKQSNSEENNKHADNVHDFDFDEDDSWLGVNVDDLNSFKANNFPSSTPMDMHEEDVEDETSKREKQNEIISKTLKNFAWQRKEKPVFKKSHLPAKDLATNVDKSLIDISLNKDSSSNTEIKNVDSNNSIVKTATDSASTNSKTENSNSMRLKDLNNSVRIKLAAFRSKNALTPPLNKQDVEEPIAPENMSSVKDPDNLLVKFSKEEKLKENVESKSKLSNQMFNCNENDTDDEMLSQLDVDAIAASYNS